MAKWTQATREAYHKTSPENFAGPDQSYPIRDGSDVGDAWGLAGHADDPDAVRAKIKAIAKRLGLTASLPDTSKNPDKQERHMSDHTHAEVLIRADATNHDPFTGTHSHTHPAMGDQGDDATHGHEHSHDGDSTHDHAHAERAQAQGLTSATLAVYLPITRYDATSREVFGQATVEQPDSYGTIFGYCPEAWTQWRGNMREQHDPKKAVGKALKVDADPQERAIYVTSKVSRGAQDTWLKIEDGVLSGYSASVIPDPEFGNDTSRWPRKEYHGKQYPYLPRYTVAELSYVDNPATPGCNISLVRADGVLTEIVDTTEEETPAPPPMPVQIDRAGNRVSAATRDSMHKSIGHTLHAAVSQMQNCGCDTCQKVQGFIDPDNDGDIDMGGYDDPDGDGDSLCASENSMDREVLAVLERVLPYAFDRILSPVYARLQAIAGTIARSNATPVQLDTLLDSALTRALDGRLTGLPDKSSFDEVRADLSAVKDQVERISETPMPGAPVRYSDSLPRPVDKRLATDPYEVPASRGATADAVAMMFSSGQLNSTEKQIDAVAAALSAQRKGK